MLIRGIFILWICISVYVVAWQWLSFSRKECIKIGNFTSDIQIHFPIRFVDFWNMYLFPPVFFINFFFYIRWFFNRFIEKLQGEIPSFLTGIYIFTSSSVKKNISSPSGTMMTLYLSQSFFRLTGFIISSHLRMWIVEMSHL